MRARVLIVGRHAHQADELGAEPALAVADEAVGIGAGDAGLLRFIAGIDLDQQARLAVFFGHGGGDGIGQFGAVEGLDHIRQPHGVAGLVGLQATDNV